MAKKILMSLGIFYPSQVGGPANTLYWLGKELASKKMEITVIVSDYGVPAEFAPRNRWFYLDEIKVKYCCVNSCLNLLKLIWLTIKEIPVNDKVMLSSFFYKPNFVVGLVALLFGKMIIWSPRGELLVPRGILKRSYLRLIKCLFRKNVLFHATSPEEEMSVYKFMGNKAKCIVIPNYMELPKKVESNAGEKYLLYVGRIMQIKALEKLIKGVSESKLFLEKGYKLYLAGKNEGTYYEKLLSLVQVLGLEDSIIFKGMVEGQDKESLFASAKATLLVSHTENFGNVIIESLAQGTPAITSKGTPWQILEERGAGYWIENSPEMIGKSIDKLLSLSETEYIQMRQNSNNLCCREFDIKTNIYKWLKILN